MSATNTHWKEISAKAQQKVLDDIPADWKVPQDALPPADQANIVDFPANSGRLSQLEVEITESLATEIVARLANTTWSAVDVTTAFCKRAAIAHQLTNCLTVIMFNDAIERAKQLDAELKKTGKPTGPLHGLPVSLKDNFNVPGYPSSVGFCDWASEPMQEESTIVSVLKGLGAIPYVKTNVPTAMMIAESVNNCYGRTLNPFNRATTSGGSSGGESALIALRGSPLGIGTDIGGSLRIPAACVGIFTIRPSYGRFPQFDARTGLAGQESVASVHGPMARSIADLQLYAKNVVATEPWRKDPKCLPIPWRDVQIKAKPKIAVNWNNGMVHPTPPVQRALKETVEKLKAKGYQIVEWPTDDLAEAFELIMRLFIADGGKSVEKILDPVGEPWRPEMQGYADATELGVYDLWQLQKRRTALQKRFLDRFQASGIDAILSPTTPYASPKNGSFRHVGYTSIYNLLDYSAVSFPSGVHADKSQDVYPADFEPFPALGPFGDFDNLTRTEYDAEVAHGLQVSLQLAGQRLEDEKILAITERVIEDLKA